MAKTVKVRIDDLHTIDLLEGQRIAIKVPEGAKVLEIELEPIVLRMCRRLDRRYGIAQIADVFFNGRPA